MNKILRSLLVLFMMLSLTACGGGGSDEPEDNNYNPQEKDNPIEIKGSDKDKEEPTELVTDDNKFYKVPTLSKAIRVNGKEYNVIPYVNNENIPNTKQDIIINFALMGKPFFIKVPDGLKGKKVYFIIKDADGMIMGQTKRVKIVNNLKIVNIALEDVDDLRPTFLEKHGLPVPPVF